MSDNKSFEIKAKIPGQVTVHPAKNPTNGKDLPGVGAVVEARQEVALIEAMKMQNSIMSPKKAAIKQIHVSSGQTVKPGDLLMTLEEL